MDSLGPYLLGPNDENQGIYTGDARELAKAIPDESVDLIFTDPPYLREYLWCYDWLAQEAKRILMPPGFVLAMAGNYWKDKVMAAMGQSLEYFWDYQIDLRRGAANSILWPRKTIALCKSVLAYRKTNGLPRFNVLGLWEGSEQDKRFHKWGQSESSARYYIESFSPPGALIFDPFIGGGTTPAVCKIIGRKWLAFEIDPDAAERARERVQMTQPPLFTLEPSQMAMECMD